MKPTGDAIEADDWLQPSIGSALSLDTTPCKPVPREFPPGFAGAAPGPSHEPPKRKSKQPGHG